MAIPLQRIRNFFQRDMGQASLPYDHPMAIVNIVILHAARNHVSRLPARVSITPSGIKSPCIAGPHETPTVLYRLPAEELWCRAQNQLEEIVNQGTEWRLGGGWSDGRKLVCTLARVSEAEYQLNIRDEGPWREYLEALEAARRRRVWSGTGR